MKKTALLFIAIATIACNKNEEKQNELTEKQNTILFAETVQSILPMEKDSLWTEDEWKAAYKYDKEKIFSTITKAVQDGKLKAYFIYPDVPLSIDDFNRVLVQWDSTAAMEDPKNPGTFISTPTKMEISASELIQLKFVEKIELDTTNYSLIKKVSSIQFFTYKRSDTGEILGMRRLFDVKLNDQ